MSSNTKITQVIQENEQHMINIRRDIHRHPELPLEEVRTTELIAEELEKIGITYRVLEPTGVIAEIVGGKPGKTVALRADIDALPVQELSDIEYKSTIDGKMHACGHDAHTAMLLNAAKALYAVRDTLPGKVRLLFQPAEEIGAGAKLLIAQGALDGVDNVFGIHIWSLSPSGQISCTPGPSFASSDIISIRFKGKGGHGSMPNDCVDAAIVASSFVMNLQAIVSRETSPLDTVVVSIGKMEVGTRFNVIAENAVLEGTVRCFSETIRQRVERSIRHYASQVAALYGATAEVSYERGTVPLINEARSAALVEKVVKQRFGEEVFYVSPPTTGGEDFSYYIQNIPGCFALVGGGNKEKNITAAHHHGCFNIDEEAMRTGAELYAQYAWNYLNQDEF